MKSKEDHFTSEMFGNRPGRPRKVNALTVAQRVAKHRATKKANSVTGNANSICDVCGANQHVGICGVGQLGHV